MQAIDIHNHFFPRSWPDFAQRFGTPNWPWIKHTEAGKADIMVGDRFFRHIYSACWDPEVRLQEMDRDGVDLQVISATPVLFAYERPLQHALQSAQLFNDAALELCSQGKGRLKSLCQVPLQDIDAACKELSRCMRAGHLGVQIGNHVAEKNLDDPGMVTFLHHCADEGAAVLHDALDRGHAGRDSTVAGGADFKRSFRQAPFDITDLFCAWWWEFFLSAGSAGERLAPSSSSARGLPISTTPLSESFLC